MVAKRARPAWRRYGRQVIAVFFSATPRAVPPAIAMFEGTGTFAIPWGWITAASVVVTVLLIVLLLLFQRRIISGLTAGAIR